LVEVALAARARSVSQTGLSSDGNSFQNHILRSNRMTAVHQCSFVGKLNWRRSGRSVHPSVHVLSPQQNCTSAASNVTTGWLLGTNGVHAGEDFRLTEGQTSLGSGWDADVVLTSPDVSRLHAKITSTTHLCVVEDCGSSTGVYVNTEKCSDPRALQNGDVLKIGLGEFVYLALETDATPLSAESTERMKSLSESTKCTRGWLICQSGELAGVDFRLSNGLNRIGSLTGVEVTIPDPNVHSIHFSLECSKDRIYLRKESSDVQILRGGLLVEAGVVKDGDQIRMGALNLKLRLLA